MTALFARKKGVKASADTLLGSDEEPRYKPIEWPLIRRLFSQLYPHRKTYVLGISMGAVMVLLDLMGPKYIGWFVDITRAAAKGTAADQHAGGYGGLLDRKHQRRQAGWRDSAKQLRTRRRRDRRAAAADDGRDTESEQPALSRCRHAAAQKHQRDLAHAQCAVADNEAAAAHLCDQ